MARLLLFGGKGGVGKTTTSSATAVWLADSGLKVLLVSSDPAHSTSDSLDVKLGPVPTEVEGVPGLYGLEMDPEAKLSNLLPKVGEAVNNMSSSGMGGLSGLGMMLDPTAKDELEDVKSDIKTADMILPGLDEALAFDELLSLAARVDRGVVGPTAPFDAGFGRHTVNAVRAKRERRHERRARAFSSPSAPRTKGAQRPRNLVVHPRHHTRANGDQRNRARTRILGGVQPAHRWVLGEPHHTGI